MKKHAKILGSLGIAAAVSMGVFAIAKPAMAEDLIPVINKTDTSAEVTVKLKVVGENPAINIATPLDGATILGKTFPVNVDYANANELEYQLIYVDTDGTKTAYDLPAKIVAATGTIDGDDSFELNIADFGGKYGTYILKATAKGAGTAVDSVQFKMISFDFTVKGLEEETNNPIITIAKAPGVYRSLIQIFDEEGNAIFEEPIEVFLDEDSDTDVTLPLARYGIPEGKYRIVATPYDEDGNIIDINVERNVNYKPAEAPEVPDTGSVFGDLNLSRQDLVSTGLALLFVCAFFGVLIIAKKARSDKRRR